MTQVQWKKDREPSMIAADMFHTTALYLDLEWTCWDAPPPPGMQPEIIEIGLVEMNLDTLDIIQEGTYFVRPRRWEISLMCANLTGITADDVRSAAPLSEVLGVLIRKFEPQKKPCCTWGDDVSVIAKTCQGLGLVSPFRHPVDLAKVFQSAFAIKEQKSLRAAIQMLDLEFDGVPHGALPDARNTARIHACILRRMRRDPEPPPPEVIKRHEIASLSPFAEKLKAIVAAQ
jgi:inhibitor of KinA sporulation pathway (predicted exonuclease)